MGTRFLGGWAYGNPHAPLSFRIALMAGTQRWKKLVSKRTEPVEKGASGPIDGSKASSKRPKMGFRHLKRGPVRDTRALFETSSILFETGQNTATNLLRCNATIRYEPHHRDCYNK